MPTHEHKALTYDYAVTGHKSQGQGKREIFHLMNVGMMDNASSLVAFTRLTKGAYRLYGTYDEVEQLHTRLGLERLKATVLDAGVKGMQSGRAQDQHSKPCLTSSGFALEELVKAHREDRGRLMATSGKERIAIMLVAAFKPSLLHPEARCVEPAAIVRSPQRLDLNLRR